MAKKEIDSENNATLPPIRLPNNLLAAARAKARRNDETLSQVVRRALRAYAAEVVQLDLEDAIADSKRRKTGGKTRQA